MQFSTDKLTDIILVYGESLYKERFSQRVTPVSSSFVAVDQRARTTGSLRLQLGHGGNQRAPNALLMHKMFLI